MSDILSLMQNPQPQITSAAGAGGGALGGILQQMLQALTMKNAPLLMGTSKVPIAQNQVTNGYLDKMGVYHSGTPT